MTIAKVQVTSVGQSASAPSLAKAFGSTNTAGNCLVVGGLIGSSGDSISSITDTAGNTGWARDGSGSNTTLGVEGEIWLCPNCKGGANTVTVHWASSAAFPGFELGEYSGVDTTTPSDATVTTKAQTTNSASYSGSAVTTATNGAMVIAVVGFNNGGTTATGTSGTTVEDNDGAAKEFFFCDLLAATAGSNNTTASLSPSDGYFAVQGALKPASGGGGGGYALRLMGDLTGLGGQGIMLRNPLA